MFAGFLHWARQRVDRLICPPRCVFCGALLRRWDTGACRSCIEDLPVNAAACSRCARPLEVPQALCGACQVRPPPVAAVRAAYRYDFPIDAAIQALKFRHRLEYLAVLAAGMRPLATDCSVVVPVPLSRWRQAYRGFNQAEELARQLALPAPVANVVRRTRHTLPQTGLDASARFRNLRGAFAVCGSVQDEDVLIVDDVMTTGSTVYELARCLTKAGAGNVSVLVAARRA